MRAILGAVFLWTAFVIALVFLDPGGGLISTACGHMVPPKPPECAAQSAAIGAAYRQLHSDPMIVAIASGYLSIAALALAGLARRSPRPPPRPVRQHHMHDVR